MTIVRVDSTCETDAPSEATEITLGPYQGLVRPSRLLLVRRTKSPARFRWLYYALPTCVALVTPVVVLFPDILPPLHTAVVVPGRLLVAALFAGLEIMWLVHGVACMKLDGIYFPIRSILLERESQIPSSYRNRDSAVYTVSIDGAVVAKRERLSLLLVRDPRPPTYDDPDRKPYTPTSDIAFGGRFGIVHVHEAEDGAANVMVETLSKLLDLPINESKDEHLRQVPLWALPVHSPEDSRAVYRMFANICTLWVGWLFSLTGVSPYSAPIRALAAAAILRNVVTARREARAALRAVIARRLAAGFEPRS